MRTESRTPVTFSRAQIMEIREMLENPDRPPTCPNCKTKLTVEEMGEDQQKGQFHVSCQACNRGGFISMQPRGGSVATN